MSFKGGQANQSTLTINTLAAFSQGVASVILPDLTPAINGIACFLSLSGGLHTPVLTVLTWTQTKENYKKMANRKQ